MNIEFAIWDYYPEAVDVESLRQAQAATMQSLTAFIDRDLKVSQHESLGRLLRQTPSETDWLVVFRPQTGVTPEFSKTLRQTLGESPGDIWLIGIPDSRDPQVQAIQNHCFMVNTKHWRKLGEPCLDYTSDGEFFGRPDRSTGSYQVPGDQYKLGPQGFGSQAIAFAAQSAMNTLEMPSTLAATIAVGELMANSDFSASTSSTYFSTSGHWLVEAQTAKAPLDVIYCQASCFMDLFLIRAHGTSESTKLVYFSDDAQILKARKQIFETWSGTGYPGLTAEAPEQWNENVSVWGGAESVARSWQLSKALRRQFLETDIMNCPQKISQDIQAQDGRHIAVWLGDCFRQDSIVGTFLRNFLHRQIFDSGKNVFLYDEATIFDETSRVIDFRLRQAFT